MRNIEQRKKYFEAYPKSGGRWSVEFYTDDGTFVRVSCKSLSEVKEIEKIVKQRGKL